MCVGKSIGWGCVSVVVLGFLGASAHAKKESGFNHLIKDRIEDTVLVGQARLSRESGVVRALYSMRERTIGATPEERAQSFIRRNSGLFKVAEGTLMHRATMPTPGGHRVRFFQVLDGYEVDGSEVVITLDREGNVVFVMSDYRPVRSYDRSECSKISRAKRVQREREACALLAPESAPEFAKDYLGFGDEPTVHEVREIAFVDFGVATPAYRILLSYPSMGDWDVIVGAGGGEVLRAVQASTFHRERTMPTGWVFDPDPVLASGIAYGGSGVVDNDDSDNQVLRGLQKHVVLSELKFEDDKYHLESKYAKITDHDFPKNGTFEQESPEFHFTRDQLGFEAVNVFFHLDQSMRYINETLGFNLMPRQYTGGVQADPHGLNGDDNSSFSSYSGRLQFGQGGVDDAEDVDVILHELGHGLHDWVTNGQLSNNEGLSEGSGDYWASSYSRYLGMDPRTSFYHWVMRWDGHNPFWPGRINNYAPKYPEGLSGRIHTDGQIWSTALMRVWDEIGREATDRLFLEALSMLNRSAKQGDAARAFLQADKNLYQGRHIDAILRIFRDVGYVRD